VSLKVDVIYNDCITAHKYYQTRFMVSCIEWRYYTPLDTKQLVAETFFPANLLA